VHGGADDETELVLEGDAALGLGVLELLERGDVAVASAVLVRGYFAKRRGDIAW
jgi:hypothetical protein